MRRVLIITAAAAALSMTLVACGPEKSGDTTNTNAGGKQASCDMVPASVVQQTLGLAVQEPSVQVNDTVLVCTYSPSPGSSGTVILRIDTASSLESFKATKDTYPDHNMQTTDYPGFGDEAYTNTISTPNLGITTNTLVTRKGAVEVQVSSSASFEQEKALEQKVFDALA
jgi:hypothetical protein